MIPEDRLSTTPVPAPFRAPANYPRDAVTDYELGGIALNDASQGLRVQVWRLRVVNEADVHLDAPAAGETLLFSGAGITEASLAFDQNMAPVVAFVQAGQSKYRWFDPVDGMTKITNLPVGSASPRCTLDDHRESQLAVSDVIIAYVRAGSLYYRQQRDRYTIERLLAASVGAGLIQIGMNTRNRLQFQVAT